MAASPQVYLIRHGETEWSLSGRHTSRTDIELTKKGRDQAAHLGRLIASIRFDRVLVSPLIRAVETARLAGLQDQIEITPGLHEWNYGDYEGKTLAQIRQSVPDWSVWSHPCPNGESAAAVGARADSVLRSIAAEPGPVALVAHGHVLRVVAARWLEQPPAAGRWFALTTASISRLGFEHESKVISLWNESGSV